MRISNTLIALSSLIVVLALVAAGVGLFYREGGSSFSLTSVRGETVQIYGHGLYYYDTPIPALSFLMGDVVTLVFGIPLVTVSILFYRRGSLKGGLLLCGVLAYNNLYLDYLALLAASHYAFLLALSSFDLRGLPSRFSNALPRRGISIYLIISGIVLALVWLVMIVIPALLIGKAPQVVESYTTFMTGVADVAIVAPALVIVGALLLRRAPLGYLLATTILIFTVVLGTSIPLGGIAPLLAGVVAIGQFIGMTFSFTILTLFALWFSIRLFRSLSEPASEQAMIWQAASSQS